MRSQDTINESAKPLIAARPPDSRHSRSTSTHGRMIPPISQLDRLRAAGLLVGKPLPGDHVAYPHGITIAKPAADPRPDNRLTAGWAPSGQRIEPSTLTLHHDGQTWTITRADQIPGPGPHDFTQSTASIEQAIELILDHFHTSSRNASQR